MSLLPWLVAAWLFGIGIYGVTTSRNYVHLIGCISVFPVGDLRAAAVGGVSLGGRGADLLRPSARHPGRGPSGASSGAH